MNADIQKLRSSAANYLEFPRLAHRRAQERVRLGNDLPSAKARDFTALKMAEMIAAIG